MGGVWRRGIEEEKEGGREWRKKEGMGGVQIKMGTNYNYLLFPIVYFFSFLSFSFVSFRHLSPLLHGFVPPPPPLPLVHLSTKNFLNNP